MRFASTDTKVSCIHKFVCVYSNGEKRDYRLMHVIKYIHWGSAQLNWMFDSNAERMMISF